MTVPDQTPEAIAQLVERLKAARVSRHGKGPLKLPSVPCLYEEAALALSALAAERDHLRGWFCGSAWYASFLPTFSQRISEMNADYAREVKLEGAQRILSRVCHQEGHEHNGTIHEYALREFVKPEQLKLSL